MGMFDNVVVSCPQCGNGDAIFQSKAGDCSLHNYALEDAPLVILADIDGECAPCDKCGYFVRIRVGRSIVSTVSAT